MPLDESQREKYLRVLDLDPSATREDIKRTFRKRAKECHPDLNPGDCQAAAKFRRIKEAFDGLMEDGCEGDASRSTSNRSPAGNPGRNARPRRVRIVGREGPVKWNPRDDVSSHREKVQGKKCRACGGTGKRILFKTRGVVPSLAARRTVVLECPNCKGSGVEWPV